MTNTSLKKAQYQDDVGMDAEQRARLDELLTTHHDSITEALQEWPDMIEG